jgi:hypothetical protein
MGSFLLLIIAAVAAGLINSVVGSAWIMIAFFLRRH